MRETIRFPKGVRPHHAEGRFCIDLTDPLTGKVKSRTTGKNHVFTDSLFSNKSNVYNWTSVVSTAFLELTNSTIAVDADLPFILGQTVGYGKPTTGSTGLYRGAYNSANQVLAAMTPDSVRWKFQYDFTTAQANGVIGTIGLTHQHTSGQKVCLAGYSVSATTLYGTFTSDGRYSYLCSTAGVITKYDNYVGSSTTIDVSATVGTNTSNYKTAGYNASNGTYYIYVYSSTAASRKMYVFTDSTFSTLSATYSPTNVAMSYSQVPMYIYGDYAFWPYNGNIYIADFVNNVAYTTTTVNTYSYMSYTEGVQYSYYIFQNGSMAYGKYLITYSCLNNYASTGIVFDMESQSVVGYITNNELNGYPTIKHPVTSNLIPCQACSGALFHNCAIAAKKLDSTVTKTSANGLTATYELEVFWE